MKKNRTLNKSESLLLLSVITGENIKDSKLIDKAKKSLIEKGFLRINKHHIIELNISEDYLTQRGY